MGPSSTPPEKRPTIKWRVTLQIEMDEEDYGDSQEVASAIDGALYSIGSVDIHKQIEEV